MQNARARRFVKLKCNCLGNFEDEFYLSFTPDLGPVNQQLFCHSSMHGAGVFLFAGFDAKRKTILLRR